MASAYITGISVGILIRSPAFWPYAVCSIVSDHVEIRFAGEGPAHLESVKLRDFGDAVSGGGNGRESEHSVGKLSFADGGDLGAGVGDYLAAEAVSYHAEFMFCRFWCLRFCAVG